MRQRFALLSVTLASIVALLSACGDGSSSSSVAETPSSNVTPITTVTLAPEGNVWHPDLVSSWQWQLSGLPVDQSVDVPVYDIDAFDNDASVIAALHAQGRKVICYLDVGSWENFRPDAKSFPKSVIGKVYSGYPDEKWLDIRQISLLAPIINKRMDICKQKGFDAVEPDNIDGYTNDTGFPLTAEDQLRYNTFIANAAHARGLSVGLKNDLDQVAELLPAFDWALSEECFSDKTCSLLQPFIDAGKAVFEVEYSLQTDAFCDQANQLNFNAMRKDNDLTVYRQPCR